MRWRGHSPRLSEKLDAAATSVSPGIAGAAQNGSLAASLEAFIGDWVAGTQHTAMRLDELQQRLGGAAGAYEGAEAGIAGGFGGG